MCGSKSSSSQASNVTDRRIGATDEAIVLTENSGAHIHRTNNLTSVTTDHGATQGAIILGRDAIAANAKVSEIALDSNVEVVEESLDTVRDVVDDGFGLAENVTRNSFDSFRQVNLDAAGLISTANKGLSDVSAQAIKTVESSTRAESTIVLEKLINTTALVGTAFIALQVLRK